MASTVSPSDPHSGSARYRSLAWNVPDPLYVTDADGAFIDVNPALLDLVGAESLEALRRHPLERLWVDPAARQARVASAFTEGTSSNECDIQRFDGEVRVVVDRCVSVTDPEDGTRVLVGTLVDITAAKVRENELRRLAVRDPLTGCYNRRYLSELTPVVEAEEDSWGVIILDLDHFKQYNDEHGHQAGDEILTRTARFIMQQLRAEDVVIRVGGDEFVALLMGDDTSHVEEVAHRLEAAATGAAPAPFSLGWSIRQLGEPLGETIRRADQQLIHVKVKERPFPRRRTKRRRSGPVNRAIVLIVDDDAGVRSAVKRYIEREGYLVLEAADRPEALTAAERHQVTLAFVDIGSESAAQDLLSALRACLPSVTLVAMSPVEEALIQAQEVYGPLYVLAKPFQMDRFITILRVVLR